LPPASAGPAYVAAETIIGLENVLDELESWGLRWGRERGRDHGLYYVRIFGDPGSDAWSRRFGGPTSSAATMSG
jgi:hypothetical protein